jgi:hypothetical protein
MSNVQSQFGTPTRRGSDRVSRDVTKKTRDETGSELKSRFQDWVNRLWTLDIGLWTKTKASGVAMNDQPDEGPTPQDAELQEGRDYYLENGLLVFTEARLLLRERLPPLPLRLHQTAEW